jgi:ArsR family transcriptional regulator, arsenate/arsenite/antimonite-responsive transcriptional repressor
MKKRASFDSQVDQLAHLSKAIGHPARIAILLFLSETGPSTCQSVVDKLPYSQSTVSGHLQKLKDEGYVKMKLHRTSSIYSIEKDTILELYKLVQSVFKLGPEKNQLSLF